MAKVKKAETRRMRIRRGRRRRDIDEIRQGEANRPAPSRSRGGATDEES